MGLIDRIENEKREKVFKELLGKKYSSLNDFDLVYNPMEEILLITVKRLVLEGKINEAEDTLFANIEKNKTLNTAYIAGEFYTMLMEMSDEELRDKNFSRREIEEGIQDIKREFSDILGIDKEI